MLSYHAKVQKTQQLSVKILGHDYAVCFEVLDGGDGTEDKGHTYPAMNTILINPHQCRQMQESTLIHEILEVLNYSMGLDLSHQTIMSLEAGIYQVLNDNPKLLEKKETYRK